VSCVKFENQEVIGEVQPTVSTKGTKVSKAQASQEKAYKYNISQSTLSFLKKSRYANRASQTFSTLTSFVRNA